MRAVQLMSSSRKKKQTKFSLDFTFQTGSVRRAAQIYFVGPFEMTSHSECMSLNGGLRGAQCSSGIQKETRPQTKFPLDFTFQTGSVRLAAQICFVGPFEMTLHSECISPNGGFRGAQRSRGTQHDTRS